MKDKRILWCGLGVFLLFIFILKGVKSPEKRILEYLKDKYKEEFVIELMGKRNSEIRAEVLPKKYIGTIRQYDSYYSSTVFVPPYGEIGDNYGRMLLKESANEYFRPKLEELFGKNILPVFTLEGGYDFPDFKKEMEKRQIKFKERPDGVFSPLSGGIYIFGRVENEEDREHYRKQIYEFIQYLKQEGMFEYTLLKIRIIDERVLTKGYRNNDNNISENLIELANDKSLNRKEYSKQRVKLMSKFDKEYNKMTDKEEVMENYSKAALNKSYIKVFGKGASLLSFFSYSPKYIISRGWNRDKNSDDYEKVKYYNRIEEVDLTEGW